MQIRIRVMHTGRVHVSPALPFKDLEKNPTPLQLMSITPYGRKNRIWIPVSTYLIEHPRGKILVDTGWHREISPDGKYNRRAQIKHMGLGHFLLNQGFLPAGESVTEQLETLGIKPQDLDFVILTHLHTDHASGLRQLQDAKKFLVSEEELLDTKKFPIRYAASMWKGIEFETFRFEKTGIGSDGESLDFFGDGSLELIRISGHTNGLTAVKINCGEKFVLLFSDGGYSEKSWRDLIPPGTALDEERTFRALQWIRETSLNPNCIESLANHDPDVIPHEILLN